jgi:hypothetical protein
MTFADAGNEFTGKCRELSRQWEIFQRQIGYQA